MSTTTTAAEAETKGGGLKKIIIAVVAILLIAGAAWFFLKPGGEKAEPEAGEIMTTSAVQVNLKDGHYLRIVLGLQMVKGAHEVDETMALDSMINMFSGHSRDELDRAEVRHAMHKKLEAELKKRYHNEVLSIYFREYVTQ